MKKISDFIDERGFVGHLDQRTLKFEFGDGTQRTATLNINEYIEGKGDFVKVLNQLNQTFRDHPTPQYVRHWDRGEWWGQEGIMSCDNFDPWFIMTSLYAEKDKEIHDRLLEMCNLQWKRFGLYWNRWKIWPDKTKDKPKLPDWRNPISLLWRHIRALNLWVLYPLLLILDVLCLVPHTFVRIAQSYRDADDTSDDKNFQLWLVACQKKMWSPVAYLCKNLYGAFRAQPKNNNDPFGARFKDGYAVHNIWKSYFFRPGDPPMYDVVLPMMKYL